jgi:hypothetical protein
MNARLVSVATYIDPPSPAYYGDRLFDLTDSVLNRDDSLLPFAQVRDTLRLRGHEVHTADLLPAPSSDRRIDYFSLGVLDRYRSMRSRPDVRLRAFVVFEPPVVDTRLYKALPELTSAFEEVYLHNTEGDGYSLSGVDTSKLRKLYWPQPRLDVIEPFWSNTDRQQRIVVVNGNHRPSARPNELYSVRIEAMGALAATGSIDLYGRGWAKWWSRASMWLPYWRHRRALMSIYRGPCKSKYEVLSKYDFSLCFENMSMKGYVTEKIFDCFYAGTIPVYLGAHDIGDLIPSDSYIDCRNIEDWRQLLQILLALSHSQKLRLKKAGQSFIHSDKGSFYRGGLLNVFDTESGMKNGASL